MLVGALGYVAAAVMTGAAALTARLCPTTGMVTADPAFAGLDLAEVGDLVFGGWDVRPGSPLESARALFSRNPALTGDLLQPLTGTLDEAAAWIRPGYLPEESARSSPAGALDRVRRGTPLTILAGLRRDIRDFRTAHRLQSVVVVNLASTEATPAAPPPVDFAGLCACLRQEGAGQLPASTLYAWAAIQEGCPYLNFTPSAAALPAGLVQRAEDLGVPVMGNDGKTGETLVKSALLPLFRSRNLEVLSWEGFNLLGNQDGQTLQEPGSRQAKVRSKDGLVGAILGYQPHSGVHIHYVPSLDDQKTAWDFIHFRGFLGARMSLQFIWQGFDSLLAAPLVLDLVRLADLARRRGEGGLMPHLAFFFKAPLGTTEHRLAEQYAMLLEHVGEAGSASPLFHDRRVREPQSKAKSIFEHS